MANYFIDRPVFAWVLAIIMMLAGGLAIMNLPVAQYPQIAPPTITVSATYPGADAQTVEDSVTQVIEQNMNGLDGLMYMSSTSDAAGNASITLTFETGTSPDIAQVQVQNKLQLAMPSLPEAVQQQGISVDKSSSNILMVAAFISDNGSLNQYDIADYVAVPRALVAYSSLVPSTPCVSGWTRKNSINTIWYLPMLFPRLRCKTTRFPVVNWVACHRRQTSN